jgi:hypothetical protein
MKWVVSFCLILLSYSVCAEPKPWMKQANPNNLGLFVWVSSSCPFSKEDLTNRLEGEFLRARLKPSLSLFFNLSVNVRCMSIKNVGGTNMGSVVSYEIRYGTLMPNGANVLYETPNHGSILVNSKGSESTSYSIKSITDDVSVSLTEYLKANF